MNNQDEAILEIIEICDNEKLDKIEEKIDIFGKIFNNYNLKMLNLNEETIKIIFGKNNLSFTSKTLSRRLKSRFNIDVKSNNTMRGRIIKFKKIINISIVK